MTARLVLALDVMGGDQAPTVIIDGANIARERFPKAEFLMVGDKSRIAPLLDSFPSLRKISHLLHTDQWVAPDEKPAAALRMGRQSSMRLTLDAVAEGRAVAAVSAGNTGALMAMAKLALRTLPGIDRPAMAQILPSRSGETVMLDLGANVVCSAENLVQFAIMGDAFARAVLGLVNPSIGLLNIGSEEMKGREELRQAAAMLRDSPLTAQFKGFIEGNDLLSGAVDVAVADGFAGNIALKTIEGTAELIVHLLRESFKSSIWTQLAYLLMRPALSRFRNRVDPRRYNGAVFVGLNGIAVKSHGSADALGFANAIGVAADMVMHGFLDKIREQITALQTTAEDPIPALGVPS